MSPGVATAVSAPRLYFDHHESELIDAALLAVTEKAPRDAAVLRGLMERLSVLGNVLSAARPLRNPTQLGGMSRNISTLTEHLCNIDGLSGDLVLPLKATLSRTFLLAKIMFLRGFIKATSALTEQGPEFAQFSHQLREELAQSIYTQLAEELFLALLRKRDISRVSKSRAADQLITIWDNAQLEIDDFCPQLESAWHARNSVTSGFGCLLGTSEYFRLVSQDCAPQFLDFFARDEVSRAEEHAFEEFLFNMTHEELNTLREAMREHGLDSVSAAWCSKILGRHIEALDHSGEIDPMALYRSYNRRQLAADFRIMAGLEGPRRTAEAYIMIHLLDQQDE
jgi:hypothetical protein